MRAREAGESHRLAELTKDPKPLVGEAGADIRSFTVTLSQQPAGTKRGQGQGSFVSSVTGLVDTFYGEVVQNLKAWTASAPKVQTGLPDSTLSIDGPHAKSADSLAGGDTESTVAEIVTEGAE